MQKRSRKRGERRYLLGNEHIPLPDYAMFKLVCRDAAQLLGIPANEVRRVYVEFIECSVKMALPESNPGELSDEELLVPRRRIQIPGVASLEVTEKSIRHWRRIQKAILHNKTNNNYVETEENNSYIQPHPDDEGPVQE